MEDHAEVLDFLDFAAHHLFGEAVFGYAVHEHSARFRLHLEDFDGEAQAREVAGDCQPGGAGTDDGHAAAGFFGDGLVGESRGGVEVGHEALELSDVDVGAFLVEDAVALTLALVAAHAAAHCGEVAAGVDYRHGVAEVAFGEFGDPVGDVVADRAPFLALGHLAVEAPLCLAYGLR